MCDLGYRDPRAQEDRKGYVEVFIFHLSNTRMRRASHA